MSDLQWFLIWLSGALITPAYLLRLSPHSEERIREMKEINRPFEWMVFLTSAVWPIVVPIEAYNALVRRYEREDQE